ncbi:MAG: hypothetical protein WD934_02555 [Gemmatimonadales bacterium]
MSPVSDIKAKVQALETEGKQVGDFETRLGNTAAALTCYERVTASVMFWMARRAA